MMPRVAVLTFVAMLCCAQDASLPRDAALERLFERRRADFERLVQMSNRDAKLWRIAPDFAETQDGPGAYPRRANAADLSPQRASQYRALFKKIGLPAGLLREKTTAGPAIFFPAASTPKGTVDSEEKGFAYVPGGEPAPILKSLDRISVRVPKPQPAFRKLRPKWYLYWRYNE